MDDPFAILTSGIKFDKRRFGSEISAFQKKDKGQQQPQQQQQQQQQQQPQPGQPHAPSKSAKKKQAKAAAEGVAAPAQEGGTPSITVFGGRSASANLDEEQQQHEERVRSGGEAGPSGANYADGVDPGCPVPSTGDPLEAANVVRKHYKIKVSGPEPCAPLRSWAELRQFAACYCSTTPEHGSSDSAATTAADGAHASNGSASSSSNDASKRGSKAADWLLSNLIARGYGQPTPIQRQAIPCLMAGRELLAVAPTGSGKTIAFCAPILLQLKALRAQARKASQEAQELQDKLQQQQSSAAGSTPGSSKKAKKGGNHAASAAAAESAVAASKELWPDAVKAVILSPSHELTAQQGRVLKHLLPGSSLKASILTRSTAAGTDFSKVDILLANPLRLATLADEGKIDLSHVRYLVLDEADKLFEMGFVEQIDAVLSACKHKNIVRALFSATLPEKVEELARTVLVDPLRVTVGVRNTAVNTVEQRLLFVGRENGKLLALRQLLTEGLRPPVLVFVATKDRARALHKELMYDGVRADSLSASQSMAARTAAVDNFRLGRTWVLVSTDLLGRGMDFVGVNTVINYDFPATTTDYIHRIGRTGRAGHTGKAWTFFTEDDKPLIRPVANLIRESGGDVPEWMTKMPKLKSKDRKRLKAKMPETQRQGETISTMPVADKKKLKRKREMIEASKRKKAKALQGADQ